MTDKILGWPEPENVGGHMVKRASGDINDTRFTCVDCGMTGDANRFSAGIDGCPERPESLDYLSISGYIGIAPAPAADRARESAIHWHSFADRIALKVDDWLRVEGDPAVCAQFTFQGAPYELRYGQPGEHGVHHIHAIKVEE